MVLAVSRFSLCQMTSQACELDPSYATAPAAASMSGIVDNGEPRKKEGTTLYSQGGRPTEGIWYDVVTPEFAWLF